MCIVFPSRHRLCRQQQCFRKTIKKIIVFTLQFESCNITQSPAKYDKYNCLYHFIRDHVGKANSVGVSSRATATLHWFVPGCDNLSYRSSALSNECVAMTVLLMLYKYSLHDTSRKRQERV